MKLCSCDPEFVATASVYGQPAFASEFLEILLLVLCCDMFVLSGYHHTINAVT
jgi:formate/nitrite transporter FocA (FNT family)